ncbi:TPA: hypothetical protein UMZ03_000923 [Stenotrophomonas maltophilia]|uniref:hypothetical protein n=1 Tax=Stenotrophomonas maltophilia TaxID=40324 RepID=UPI0013DD81A4|nr:hypothetical protein [Stenotrophomonas maltophilia]HDS1610327.1 hypothetical protein [Stenotrophomonas maltophilia]HDS1645308.1 hypothetical protein [Stenotrophomonas maltophilia]HEL3850227.1 hypothetical protein [Stenotrophomonas maltophilia]
MADSQAPQRFRRAPFKHGNSPIEKGAVSGPFFIRINHQEIDFDTLSAIDSSISSPTRGAN